MCPDRAPDPQPAAIIVRGLAKGYPVGGGRRGETVTAVRNLDLVAGRGEFVTLFGPNGCGKSTILKVLAGLEPLDAGEVLVSGLGPGGAEVGFVFQDYKESLFAWRTALDNVAFPLEARGTGRRESRRRAKEFCEELGLRLNLDAYPYQLSGGQQQMIAIARALVYRPAVLLLDEPFSALDFQTNALMEDLLLGIWRKLETTVVFVSHEIDQAIYLAQKVVLLTRAPARVARELVVTLDGRRTQAVKGTAAFVALRGQALEVFRREAAL